ncbi:MULTISPECIES: ABATE domain-containing protein [unclassified Crossiella]|uniref:CGNR zinc finger domain-containing protein n=1 Tax=unclassified Crossiella TaxID=2620835 RepID=UPI001FFE993C|nr:MULTISPECIES: ABATE domain-containing protein [unclassified Crossiella]MCK2240393.1 CGNR zinc finger domain-containing protein [Crossiella sp. S99.2]MCK2253155.1 CGNR zinc finger domain-containing protein [Crossiella sp. S99.1]
MGEESAGLPMVGQDGQHYRFNPGALCLELLVSGGAGERAKWEVLHRVADLREWLKHTRLGPARIRMSAAELAELKVLRESIWFSAGRVARGKAPGAFEDWNRLAQAPPPVPELTGQGRRWREPISGAALLSAFARDAIELFGGPYRHRVRHCAAADCHLLFVDTSRPGARRWCSMQRCGNRAKQRVRQEAARGHA